MRLASELRYLLVHLIQRPTEYIFQPRPPMVGKVVSQQPGLFQEHAYVAQFGDLRLCHMAVVSQGASPFLYEASLPPSVQLAANPLKTYSPERLELVFAEGREAAVPQVILSSNPL
jgi:hypothetical protein